MNFLNHRQKTPGHVLIMPEGLQELMGDISREVLRCQPSIDCTYKFIADYLETMANTRDKCKIAMEIIEDAILKTDEVYSQFAKCNFPKDKTNSFLDMMEITFRSFVDQKRQRKEDARFIKFHADDMLDELVRKCDLTKVELLRARPAIQWAYRKFVKTYLAAIEGTLDTEDLYFNTEKVIASSNELNQMNQSAIQIQKVFRGYKTRKSLQKSQNIQFKQELSEDSSSTSSFRDFIFGRQEEMTKAAIKIQNVLGKKKVSLKLYNPDQGGGKLYMSIESSLDISEPLKDEEIIPRSFTEGSEVSPLDERIEVIQEIEPLECTHQEDSNNNFQNAEEVLELPNTDPQDINEAAVKIQATFKGYRVRKEMALTPPNKENQNLSGSNIHSSNNLEASKQFED